LLHVNVDFQSACSYQRFRADLLCFHFIACKECAALRAPEKRSDKVMAKQTKTFIFIFHLRLKSGSARDRHQTFAGIGGLLIANLNERQSSRVTRRCFLTWDMGSSFNF
jgi:hypothetical protein